MFMKACPQYTPAEFTLGLQGAGGDYERWAARIYGASVAADSGRWAAMMAAGPDTARIMRDPAWRLYTAISQLRAARITPVLTEYNTRMTRLNRLYMAAQMRQDSFRTAFPDANFSLRLSYGHVRGIDPDGPAGYSYQTTIDEIMAKDNPGSEEFRVPERQKALYAKKDFGRWRIVRSDGRAKKNTTLPVAFIADNHTSGGNSGSPVLNARGELIGTNFDRIWEGTMSDLYFDPSLCRNISVDVRYTLWVIEKFGGAGWLLKEMKLVGK